MSTFTLPFPEYDIANILQDEFPKKDMFSIAIPLSRQQKFYDLLLVKGDTKKSVTIQVKSSRTYIGKKENEFGFASWLNWFDISENYSDFYFIYMTYPLFDTKTLKTRAKWSRKVLVFNREEMAKILDNVKTKSGTREKFFGFDFSSTTTEICGSRGFSHWSNFEKDFSKNLLEKKIGEIKKCFLEN